MKRLLTSALLSLAVPLTGCPYSNGFGGRVVSATGPVQVISVPDSSDLTADTLVPIAGMRITCEGGPKVDVAPDGRFHVSLGNVFVGSADPPPIVLHVTAPGYEPIDVEMPRPPGSTELGPRLFVIVMRRAAVARAP